MNWDKLNWFQWHAGSKIRHKHPNNCFLWALCLWMSPRVAFTQVLVKVNAISLSCSKKHPKKTSKKPPGGPFSYLSWWSSWGNQTTMKPQFSEWTKVLGEQKHNERQNMTKQKLSSRLFSSTSSNIPISRNVFRLMRFVKIWNRFTEVLAWYAHEEVRGGKNWS